MLAPLLVGALRPGPDQARSWVEEELRDPAYHRGLLERVWAWVGDRVGQLLDTAGSASGASAVVALLVLVVVVVLVLLLASRVRPDDRTGRADDGVRVQHRSAPGEHRAAAESAMAEGAYDRAVVEGLRALAAGAAQRGLLDDRPGLTARELTVELSPAFPDHASALARAAMLFDLVFYGDLPAEESDARDVLDLERALERARPVRPGSDGLPQSTAVPR